jgi:hypothetical protein
MAYAVVKARPRPRCRLERGAPEPHARRLTLRALAALGVIASISTTQAAFAQTNPPPAYGTPSEPPLQAGGLTPPPTTSAQQQQTIRELQRAEHEDSGRGLEFVWLNAEAGYEYLSLQGLKSDGLLDGVIVPDDGSAFTFGVGAGVRLIFLTVGARFRLAQLGAYDLWTLNGEVGLHIPLGALEPYVVLGAGYASLGGVDSDERLGFDASEIDASGFDVRLGGGLDWYVNPLLSLGVQGTVELLALSRSGANVASTVDSLYSGDGNGLGLGVTLTAVVGVHF